MTGESKTEAVRRALIERRERLFQNSPGQRYRVVYSPISKTVWELEPPDLRIRG